MEICLHRCKKTLLNTEKQIERILNQPWPSLKRNHELRERGCMSFRRYSQHAYSIVERMIELESVPYTKRDHF